MKKTLFFITFSILYFSKIYACTVIYYSDGAIALAGNNEDFIFPYTQIIFCPPEDSKYGCVFLGFTKTNTMIYGDEQGGMNDQGLFYDGLSTPPNPVMNSKDKPTYYGNIMRMVLEKCATVDQALAMLEKYYLGTLMTGQIMLGDALGNSAIVEGDVIIRKENEYMVCTNFCQSQIQNEEYSCERYITATNMFDTAKTVNAEFMSKVLNAVHIEGEGSTQYSTVYNLKEKKIHVYHFHNFDQVVTLDLDKELKRRKHAYHLENLFPKNEKFLVYKENQIERFENLEKKRKMLLESFQKELFKIGEIKSDSVSAMSILNKYFRSIGGRTRLDEIKNIEVSGKIVVPLGGPLQLDGIIKSYISIDSKIYQYVEIKGFEITERGFDNKICWKKHSYLGIQLLQGDEKLNLLLEAGFESSRPELYSKQKYLGISTIENTTCYKVLLTTKDGFSLANYYDINSGLLKASMKIVKTRYGGPKKIFTIFEEYQESLGLKLPQKISETAITQNPFGIRTDYYTIEFNYKIIEAMPDKYFSPPEELLSRME